MARTPEPESVAAVERWFREQWSRLWPAGLGSLTLRRAPCVRPNCYACQTGEQHPSYVLYGHRNGKRVALYIPDALEEHVRRALGNGRRLQALLYEAAQRYTRALKRERGRGR
jgi:hypothetical protein